MQPPTPTLPLKARKYKIAEMLVNIYGYKNIKQGKQELLNYCQITNTRTIDGWLSIESGDDKSIHPFLINKVLSFFSLQEESQLFTDAHKSTLINVKA
ncbi:MAG: hypothetical protein NTZ59_02335 [Bacteroidetes bacterium]|nr:hypothetical protein [Bacteroidota bacterium]